MKYRITGIISLLGGIGWSIAVLFMILENGIDNFFAVFALFVTSISIVLYVIWTKFGKKENSELEKLEYQNKILREQIRQKELKKKLEEEHPD